MNRNKILQEYGLKNVPLLSNEIWLNEQLLPHYIYIYI